MAQKILTVLTDDIDGKELSDGDGETVSFALDGRHYEIDLSNKNAEKMRAAFADYIQQGRRVARNGNSSRSKRTQIGPSAQVVRDWARSNGHDVPERGRIPGHIRDAYDAAN